MKILVTGGTGFIGKPLVARLAAQGHECTLLVRGHRYQPDPPPNVSFTPISELHTVREMEAVINLAGESVGARWSTARKQQILWSRVDTTQMLVQWMNGLVVVPRVFLSGSAVGIYGHRPDEFLTENSPLDPRRRFRFEVCNDWERAAEAANALRVRTVLLRMGNVISPTGGLVGTILPQLKKAPFLMPIAPDTRFSWIALRDTLRMIEFAMEDEQIEGPLNVVAPESSNLRTLVQGLGKLSGKPVFGALPSFAAKLALGEMGQALTDSQDVHPAKALAHGFRFEVTNLAAALGS